MICQNSASMRRGAILELTTFHDGHPPSKIGSESPRSSGGRALPESHELSKEPTSCVYSSEMARFSKRTTLTLTTQYSERISWVISMRRNSRSLCIQPLSPGCSYFRCEPSQQFIRPCVKRSRILQTFSSTCWR